MMFKSLLPYTVHAQMIHLNVWVTPGASQTRMGKVREDSQGVSWLKLYVTAPPEQGKANEAVIEFLAKELNIAKSALSLFSGAADRRKRITIHDKTGEVEKQLLLLC